MNYLIQFQINLFALLVLAVLFIYVRSSVMWTFSKQLFTRGLIATASAVILEPLTWILDREVFPGAFFLGYVSNFALFLAAPVIGGLLMSYVDYRLFHNPQRISGRLYYQHASMLTLAVLTVNLFMPVYFSIDPIANAYSSGHYKLYHYFVVGSIYVYMLFFVMKNRRRVNRKEA